MNPRCLHTFRHGQAIAAGVVGWVCAVPRVDGGGCGVDTDRQRLVKGDPGRQAVVERLGAERPDRSIAGAGAERALVEHWRDALVLNGCDGGGRDGQAEAEDAESGDADDDAPEPV
jgi:hypothetical protein